MRAVFSSCGRYRYQLHDSWDDALPVLPWILCNPSVAGAVDAQGQPRSDPTARKGRGFSQRLGYGAMVFANLFAYVSTDPKGLKAAGYPVGPENDRHILEACARGDGGVVLAWGALGRGLARAREVEQLVRDAGYQLLCLGHTRDGLPRHPLMLGYATTLELF